MAVTVGGAIGPSPASDSGYETCPPAFWALQVRVNPAGGTEGKDTGPQPVSLVIGDPLPLTCQVTVIGPEKRPVLNWLPITCGVMNGCNGEGSGAPGTSARNGLP